MNFRKNVTDVKPGSGPIIIFVLGITTSLAIYFREYLSRIWHLVTAVKGSGKKRELSLTPENLKKLDIEIRYETEKDADAALLVDNVVKVIKIVLLPVAPQVKQEEAKLIFVFSGDSWEIRMRNASDELRNNVRALLEAKEW